MFESLHIVQHERCTASLRQLRQRSFEIHFRNRPFRQTAAPIPGASGITVGRMGDERYGFAHVALDLWRPSLAYLAIVAIVAVPPLAALLSGHF